MASGIQIGSTFAGYSIEGVLGRGGMGVVYLAAQPELGRKVAIKVIAPALASDPAYLERFKHESRLAAAIEHPNAIPIYEAGVADGEIPYLVMRYVDGLDLATAIRRQGKLEPARAARIVEQVSGALDEAHAAGLVHRDVKPGNVIVEERRGGEQAYLTDFGLTKQMDATSGVTATGRWVGTIDYAAPEQIKAGHVDARSDVYALGCVLFIAVTGKLPFEREADVAKLYAHINDAPPAPSSVADGVPPQLDAVVARALEKQPERRFPSAGDLGRAALASVTGSGVGGPERSVATGEAAPTPVEAAPAAAAERSEAGPATQPLDTPPDAAATPAAPAAEASTGRLAPAPPAQGAAAAGRSRRGRWVLAIAGAALLGGLAVLGVVLLGGGDGGKGAGGADGAGGIEFQPFADATAFTVDIPAGWQPKLIERQLPTAVKTELVSPDDDGNATIAQQGERPLEEVVSKALAERQQEAEQGGFAFDPLSEGEAQTINGHEALLFGYQWKEPGIGPATAFNYAFNDGGSGWRTRAAVSGKSEASIAKAREIATEMANTFEPR